MKKVKFIEFLIMALFLATSCQKESHEDIVKDGPVISLDTNNVELTAEGSSLSLSIKLNTSWTVSSNESWCRVCPTSGIGEGIVTVSVDENTTTSARMATITIVSETITKTISVTQKGTAQSTSQDRTFTVGGVQFKMISVEGGTFKQGNDARDNQKPAHSVTLSSYSIGETEVTQALWQAVMGSNPSYSSGSNLPVETVSWNNCQDFIFKLNMMTGENFRLPTEAEWEFAARGGNKSRNYKYAGSNTIDDVAWYDNNSSVRTHDIATKQPNELGLYDMSGNVFEWCSDWWGSYSSFAQTNPTGPTSGRYRVLRGGGVSGSAGDCSTSFRMSGAPSSRYHDVGLRLALLGPDISLDTSNMEFTSWSGNKTFKITSNTSWTVSSDKSWCTVSPSSGLNNSSVTVTVDGNASTSSRTATITVKSVIGILTVKVNQEGVSPSPSQDRTFTVGGVQFKMIAVEGGTFTMGTPYGEDYTLDDEKPVHSVTLSSYSIGETEVTQALWQAVMGSNPSYFSGSIRPVEQVSWNDCQDFITRLNAMTGENFRLPTEAEWEFAARGGNKSRRYKYAGSNSPDDVAWHYGNSSYRTHDVATKQPNELGLYDMSGNVWEWCNDWYGSYSYGRQTNPTGPASGDVRVRRGGSWHDGAKLYCRVSSRSFEVPSARRNYYLGFRLAL